jgi:hypothetical protein
MIEKRRWTRIVCPKEQITEEKANKPQKAIVSSIPGED